MAETWITVDPSNSDDKVVVAGLEIVTDDHISPKITFMAYVKDFSWNSRDGELNIKLAAPMDQKHAAMAITDHPGMMLDITATLVTFDDDDDDGDDDGPKGRVCLG